MIAMDSYLMHGPLMGLAAERDRLVAHMIADLTETGNFRDRGDAVKQLHHDGYKVLDVLILVDDAIYACKQDAIAREMVEC